MDYQQMFLAMKAIAPNIAIGMRSPGDWYIVGLPEIGGDGMLSSYGGSSADPQRAITDAWARLVLVQAPKYLVIKAISNERRQVRWNGFMWEDAPVNYPPLAGLAQPEGE